jgi:hypothetical protein
MNTEIKDTVRKFVAENPGGRAALDAIVSRGRSAKFAEEEIARVLIACLWETNRGMPDRLAASLEALAAGKSAADLFPDSLYGQGGSKA